MNTKNQLEDTQYKVFIIESPSPNDLLQGIKEGSALKKALELFQIPSEYYLVADNDHFVKAFDKIVEDILVSFNKNRIDTFAFIHISIHGSQSGIKLTSGEIVDWFSLGFQLNRINEIPNIANILPNGERISSINLCLSTCFGIHARNMCNYFKHSPYGVLISCEEEVPWNDA